MHNNVVYKLVCSCGAIYIGETERNLAVRLEEHAKVTGSNLSAVGLHLAAHPDHTVDMTEPGILGSSNYRSKLLIKEALYIQEHRPILNIQVDAKKLCVFNT